MSVKSWTQERNLKRNINQTWKTSVYEENKSKNTDSLKIPIDNLKCKQDGSFYLLIFKGITIKSVNEQNVNQILKDNTGSSSSQYVLQNQ